MVPHWRRGFFYFFGIFLNPKIDPKSGPPAPLPRPQRWVGRTTDLVPSVFKKTSGTAVAAKPPRPALGPATEFDLAQACRQRWSRAVTLPLCLITLVAIVATGQAGPPGPEPFEGLRHPPVNLGHRISAKSARLELRALPSRALEMAFGEGGIVFAFFLHFFQNFQIFQKCVFLPFLVHFFAHFCTFCTPPACCLGINPGAVHDKFHQHAPGAFAQPRGAVAMTLQWTRGRSSGGISTVH